MDIVLSGLNFLRDLVYLYDVTVCSETLEQHIERLQEVFKRLRQANLNLKPERCKLMKQEVHLLEHVVSASGVATDPENISKVSTRPVPRCLREVRAFWGLCSYYRKFVPVF